jgi:hypothetical protein
MPAGLAAIALKTLTTRPQRASGMPASTAAASAAGGDDVDLEGQAQLPGRDGDGGAERLDGGRVVDQDVDAARLEHGHCRAAAVLLIGQVGGHDADPPGGHAPLAQKAWAGGLIVS